MEKFLHLKTCHSGETEPTFGIKRLCYIDEKPKEGSTDEPKKKPLALSDIGADISDEESGEALQKAKANREERKEVVADTKDELAALRASLGPLPGSPEAEKRKTEDEAKRKRDEEEKKKEGEKGKEKKPGKIERAPDAMTGSQFIEAFDRCKNHEERQRLIMEQAAKGAFSPDSMTPKYYDTEVDGKKVRVKMLNNIEFGVPGDSVRVAMDGQTSQAIADMLGGTLPSADFYRRVYSDPNVQKMPFFYGGTLETEWRRKGGHPSTFHVTDSRGRTYPSGKVMQSGEYMAMHSQMQDEWLDRNGVDRKLFMVGGRKTVFAPDVPGAPDGKIVFGGGLYAVPYQVPDPNNPEKTRTEYRVDDTPDKFVQGIGDHAHEPTWHDYAAGTDIVLSVEVEGKEVPMNQFMTDEKYEGTRKALFGPGSSIENRYNLPPWMQGYVDDYRKTNEGKSPVGAGEVKAQTPSRVFEGISAADIQKGTVTDEYDYTVAGGAPGGHVKFVKTGEGDIAIMGWQGRDYQVKVDLNNSSGVGKSMEGYGAPGSEIAGPFAYVMLPYFRKRGYKKDDIVPFEYNGQQYLAQYQIHNDGPNGPIPYDHPGVGIMMKKETDAFSGIPRTSGLAQGPAPFERPQKSGDLIAPPKPSELIVPPPKVGGGAPRAKVASGGGTYGGGVPSYSPAPGYSPGPAPSYSPPAYVPPYSPDKPKPVPVERKESGEYIIKGSTLFLGDSNSVAAFSRATINVEGNIHTIAKGSMDADWVLSQLEEFEKTGELKNFKNMVVTAGVNGIGRGPVAIFNTLKKIWEIGKKYGIKVYAGTLAPFKGWGNFGTGYERYNEIRKEVNRMIRESQEKEGIPTAIIPYDELCADPSDPDKLAPEYDSGDHLHIKKAANAKLVASVAGERLGNTKDAPEVQGAPEQVDYTINQGAPGGVISYYPSGEAKMTFQGKEYSLKVDTKYQTPDLTKPPEGYTINTNPSLMPAVIDFALLHSMLKWNKPQGTEMPFEYEGVQYIAKLAWHTDHPGADLYVKA